MGLVQRGENKGGFFSSESSITNVGFENAGVVESVTADHNQRFFFLINQGRLIN